MKRRGQWAFIDVLFLLVFMLLVLPHNPETQADDKRPGMVLVEIRWPDGLNIDVDLWVQAPGDVSVGYSRRAGEYFNLLRDDLGSARDALELNYETSYTRGSPEGEYTVNVHMYNNYDPLPVVVDVTASTRINGSLVAIFTKTVTLTARGQELTVARFSLGKNGFPVAGSIHDFPKALRG